LDRQRALHQELQQPAGAVPQKQPGAIPDSPHQLGGAGREVYQRVGTYLAPDAPARNGAKPLSLRFLGRELVAFDPPAGVELSLPKDDPATSATITARFSGVRAKIPVHFVLAAGYPVNTRDRMGVRVQTDEITAEKREGNYVVSLDDLDPSSFPMSGYLANRLVQLSREYSLDVVHAHYAVPHATAAYLAKQVLAGTHGVKVPKVITTLHGTDITLLGSDPSYSEIVTFSIEQSDGVTAVSESLKADTYGALPLKRDIRVIPNFLECDFHRRRSLPELRARPARVVAVARGRLPGQQLDPAVRRVLRPVRHAVPAVHAADHRQPPRRRAA
jgi:glycosyltransferase involved in cell wall biosynthesis